MTIKEAAARLRITRATLSRILHGHAGITAGMSLRLSEVLGTSPEFWLRMQIEYDLWQARKRAPQIQRLAHRQRMVPAIPPPPVQADFWQKQGYPMFIRFWEVCNRLFDALNKLTLYAGPAKDTNEIVICTLCISIGISFADVSMLVGHGHGLGAKKIARTCLESAINAEYLRVEPDEYRDFLDWNFIEQHRKLEYMRRYMPNEFSNLDPNMVAETETQYKAFAPRFLRRNKTLRSSWCRQNLRERAVRADFEQMYNGVYGASSELSHGSFGGLAQHVESFLGNNWQPAVPPSFVGCAHALQTAHYCTFRVLQTLVLLKGTESDPPRVMLKNDYDSAWSKKT